MTKYDQPIEVNFGNDIYTDVSTSVSMWMALENQTTQVQKLNLFFVKK